MPSSPRVSVAICLYDSLLYIEETLESVFAQTYADFEVVVVDDGSNDGCADFVERRFRDRRLRLVRQRNQGLGHARARSLQMARSPYLAFLDHDDLWIPRKLELQLEEAATHPDAVLLFSETLLIDSRGHAIGPLDRGFSYDVLDLNRPLRELLLRGCFIDVSNVLARTEAVRAVGGFNPTLRYVADFDLWLRLARTGQLCFVPGQLSRRRLHAEQLTETHPLTSLREETALLRPLIASAAHPADVRHALVAYLFGQHRACFRKLVRRGRLLSAAWVGLGTLRGGARLGGQAVAKFGRAVSMSIPRAAQPRWTTTAPRTQSPAAHRGPDGEQHIWVDGSVLSIAPVGHFNLVVGLVQSLLRWDDGRCAVHVVATREGHRRLLARLEGEKRRPLLHAHCRPQPGSIEVIVWKGRFRQRRSLKIAIVPDLTTRIHPELHTPNNIADFERYLAHVLRRANTIATVSRSSRQDILARLPLYPESVAILPVAVSPLYLAESYPEEVLARLNVAKPYLLFVGTVEPRKNLRRLVEAFERIVETGGPPRLSLVLAGPNGWDEGFDEFLARRPRAATVRRLGQVDIADLPSLYHHAAAVVYPSLYEGYGLPVLEGMCCGGAVLASRVSSMPEVLGEDGLYFDPRDVADIAGTIRGVLRLGPDADRLYRALLRSRAEDILTRAATEPPLPGLEPEAMP